LVGDSTVIVAAFFAPWRITCWIIRRESSVGSQGVGPFQVQGTIKFRQNGTKTSLRRGIEISYAKRKKFGLTEGYSNSESAGKKHKTNTPRRRLSTTRRLYHSSAWLTTGCRENVMPQVIALQYLTATISDAIRRCNTMSLKLQNQRRGGEHFGANIRAFAPHAKCR